MPKEIGRSDYVKRNIISGQLASVISLLMSFIARTIFIRTLGATYLGVNGLFANVLGILSFSELGIGSAINYSLYAPIANHDDEKVKALLKLYKTAYRIIAAVVAVLGILLLPFLDYLVSSEAKFEQLHIYYLIFLFNSVSSYFVTYKSAYVNAKQEGYILTYIGTAARFVLTVAQIVVLIFYRSFLIYLLTQSVLMLLEKAVTVVIIDRKYPILRETATIGLHKSERQKILKNVKALILHKIGDVSVHQTDNIIISVFSSTLSVGLVSNYITLNQIVHGFTYSIFNSFVAGFGNMIASEDKKKQHEILEAYNFVGYWVYAFVFVAFVTLSQPFIELWIGKEMQVDNLTMVLYFFSVYLANQTFTIYNFKIAAGIFSEDKWYALIQAVINLLASIIAIQKMGLPGVYVGTIISRMVVVITRPYVVYKTHFNESPFKYYLKFSYNLLTIFVITFVMNIISSYILTSVTIVRFSVLTLITAILVNVLIFGMNCWRKEVQYICKRLKT